MTRCRSCADGDAVLRRCPGATTDLRKRHVLSAPRSQAIPAGPLVSVLLTIAVCGRELDMCAITAGPLVTVVAGAEVTRPRDNS